MSWVTLADVLRDRAEACGDKTAYTFLADGHSEEAQLTYRELDRRAQAIARRLTGLARLGDRALLLYPDGLDFVTGFMGCVAAGAVAVPTYPPDPTRLARTAPRLAAIAEDSEAEIILTNSLVLSMRDALLEHAPRLGALQWIATDALEDDATPAGERVRSEATPDDICFLQYTSGSTGNPKGVMVSHANLLHNESIIESWLGNSSDTTFVLWLPVFHDMGLIGELLQSLYVGGHCVVMSPIAFLQRPHRWMEACSRYGAHKTGGPNFAFDLALRKTSAEQRQGLDLSRLTRCFNGAEPVRARTLERFSEAFAPCGFRPETFNPCYGLAEATLVVSGGAVEDLPVIAGFRASALEEHRVEEAAPDDADPRRLVGSGRVLGEQRVVIVDPETHESCAPDEIGEIWISGPSVCRGYWRRPEESAETFGAHLADGDGPFLRSGDLGFLWNGELFITGRCKDLIIIRGRNYAPQDIELSAQEAHPCLRPGCCAAFAVDDGGEERLVIVQEAALDDDTDPREVVACIREAVAADHQLSVHAIALLAPRTIAKTSSGKIQRSACHAGFLAAELPTVFDWRAPQAAAGHAEAVEVVESGGPDWREIESWLVAKVAAVLGIAARDVDPLRSFERLGFDSARGVEIAADLEDWLGRPVSPTAAWEEPSIRELARSLSESRSVETLPEAEPLPAGEIAVIGLGCRFPGADGPEAFWRLLRGGVDAIREIPQERAELAPLSRAYEASRGQVGARWGGFLDDVADFDAPFFGISPREAAAMDPQQRLLLEVAHEALEDAGVVVQKLPGTRTGVFIGASGVDYAFLKLSRPGAVDAYFGTGSSLSINANRLSHVLGLRGPSLAVDTACSSSLVAIHLACKSLRDGESDLAVAGGVNLILAPEVSIGLSRTGAFAADGRCKAFSAHADGYVRSEGVGVVILKPLMQALADEDRIYAVVRGGAVNNDGASNGLMAPSPAAQREVLRAAYRSADVDPASVDYVEAHGTGTPLGDPIEAQALSDVVCDGPARKRPCVIGSVKSNIGHLEAAAGVAGFIKATLALHHQMIPPSLHAESRSPLIDFERLRLDVASDLCAWPRGARPARAGVSSFGFGGTNAHLVLEQAPAPPEPDRAEPGAPARSLVPLSAHSADALRALAESYREWIAARRPDAAQVAFAAGARRSHYGHRLAVVARTAEELEAALADAVAGPPLRGHASAGAAPAERRIAFVFSGQGSQWLGMGRELFAADRVFRSAVEACCAELAACSGHPTVGDLFRAPEPPDPGDRVDLLQPAIFAIQIGLARLLEDWGVVPEAVIGHSMGEVAAAHIAGALSLGDAARVMTERCRALHASTGRGSTALLELSVEECREWIERAGGGLCIAAANAPRISLVSGDRARLDELVRAAEREGIFARVLKVTNAAHSPEIEPWLPRVEEALVGLAPSAAAVRFVSTVEGHAIDGALLDASYWARNLREPVRFWPAIESLVVAGTDALVEISPHPVLVPSLRQALAETKRGGVVALGTLRREASEEESLLDALAELYASGCELRWERQWPEAGAHVVEGMPRYPWQHEAYWLSGAAVDTERERAGAGASLASPPLQSSLSPSEHYWEVAVGVPQLPYLSDHRVGGSIVLPAAFYLGLCCAAAARCLGAEAPCVRDLRITEPLLLADTETRLLQVALRRVAEGEAELRFSTHDTDGGWRCHAVASVHREDPAAADEPLEPLAEIRERCHREISHEQHYAEFAAAQVEYGPSFRGVERLWAGKDEALGCLRLPEALGDPAAGEGLHPALLDAAFQVLAGCFGADTGPMDAPCLPTGLEAFRVGPRVPGDRVWCHVRAAPPLAEGEDLLAADVVLRSDEGELLAAARRLEVRRIGDRGPVPLETLLYEIRWEISEPSAPASAARDRRWVVCADAGGVGAGLADALRAQDAEVREIPRVADGDGRREALRDLFRDVTREGPCELVYAAGLDVPATAALDVDWLAAHGSDACVDLVGLVQAAAGQTSLRLSLLTRGVHALSGEMGAIAVAQAPLAPLARVIGLENPELAPRTIDLDPDGDAEETGRLLAELLGEPRETAVALRREGRYVARLARALAGPEAERDAVVRAPEPEENFAWLDGPEGPVCRALPRRSPEAGEVEIRVARCAVARERTGSDPGALHCDQLAGSVVRVGPGVEDPAVGDAVVAIARTPLSRYATLPAGRVARRPAELELDRAVALLRPATAACLALDGVAKLRSGERVLIGDGLGAAGAAAAEIARRRGALAFTRAGLPDTEARELDVVLDASPPPVPGARADGPALRLAASARWIQLAPPGSPPPAADAVSGVLHARVDLERLEAHAALRDSLHEALRILADEGIEAAAPLGFPASEVPRAAELLSRPDLHRPVSIDLRDPGLRIEARTDRFAADATILVTGGLGGLGLALAEWMVDEGARSLVLAGRTPPSDAARAAVARLAARGARIEVRTADVADAAQVEALLDEVDAGPAPLRGVVHAAGVLDDGTLGSLGREQFERVFAPKVQGAWNLHRATQGRELDFFVLFSSAASLVGSPGQANYSAANGFLDALAQHRRASGLPALSVAWGPWAERGAAAAQANRARRLAARGLRPLVPDDAFRTLARLLDGAPAQTGVMDFDPERWLAFYPAAASWPLFAGLRGGAGGAERQTTLRREIECIERPSEREERLAGFLRDEIAQILRRRPEEVVADQPLSDLGLDSLMAVELRNRVEAELGVALPSVVIFAHPTLARLAPALLEELRLAPSGPEQDAEGERRRADTAFAEQLATISEQEAEELLARKLAELEETP